MTETVTLTRPRFAVIRGYMRGNPLLVAGGIMSAAIVSSPSWRPSLRRFPPMRAPRRIRCRCCCRPR